MPRRMQARRTAVEGALLDASSNAGLWLDRYSPAIGGDGDKAALLDQVMGRIGVPDIYVLAFKRWIESFPAGSCVFDVASATGRLAVGLGADSVLETSLRLHKTYGTPVLPGSALKGLASHFCKKRYGGFAPDVETCNQQSDDNGESWQYLPSPLSWKRGELEKWLARGREPYTYFDQLFGHRDLAGSVVFHDAWFVPGSAGNRPFTRDVMTVHHPHYYRGENAPPADYDQPTPIPHVDVRPGANFLLVLEGAQGWREFAGDLLLKALAQEGVGAKTSSGYGRMDKVSDRSKWSTEESVRKAIACALVPPEKKREADRRDDLVNRWDRFGKGEGRDWQRIYEDIVGIVDPGERAIAAGIALSAYKKQIRNWKNERAQWRGNLEEWAGRHS